MARFNDRAGREWVVEIDVPNIRRVRERTEFHLGKMLNDRLKGLNELASDIELLCNVLFVLVEEQAKKLGIDDQQFGRSLSGDSLSEAFDAIVAAYADFSPSHRRELLLAMATKEKEYATALTAQAIAEVNALDVQKMLTTNSSATSAPGSAGSTLAPPG